MQLYLTGLQMVKQLATVDILSTVNDLRNCKMQMLINSNSDCEKLMKM